MTKRLVLVALVVVAALVVAAPAMAFDGYRSDYTLSTGLFGCGGCHSDVQAEWGTTMHSSVGAASVVEDPPGTWELSGTANAEPIADGPGCAGCHSGNYDPKKHIEDPVTGFYPWTNTAGDDAFTEPFVGCSSCHRGLPTSHQVADVSMANMANPDICGQCHSRYSASVAAYENYDGTFTARQYTLGDFNPLGTAANAWTPDSITAFLNIPTPTAPQSMLYYQDPDGNLLPWSARGHEEGAQQYNEWAMEGHADSLQILKDEFGEAPFLNSCLECHSADYRLAKAGEKPTISQAKYGITCQACHDPHEPSDQTSLWNEERNPQLTAPRKELCVECHNGEIPAGETATPGADVHHPMKEMMNGTGAIDVPQGSPSVHKDKCVNCHMVPTDYDRNGVPMTGANHVFAIVEPDVAAEALSTGNISGVKKPMPYSSCSSCHAKAGDPYAQYLSGTFENRQTQMHAWDDQVGAELTAAAARMGYASIAAARTGINEKAEADWNGSELAFMKAYTNRSFIESEGSWGIHNYDYARTVILKALEQAKSVKDTLDGIAIDGTTTPYSGSTVITYGQTAVISGQVVGGDPDLLLGGMAVLWAKPASGARFTPAASMYLFGDDVDMYRFSVMPAETTAYKVQFAGNMAYEALVSSAVFDVQVKWKVTAKRSRGIVMVGKSVKISGTVAPMTAGMVAIERKKGSGAWKKVGAPTLSASSTFAKVFTMKAKGTYRFRVTFAADAAHLAGVSNTVKVVVR